MAKSKEKTPEDEVARVGMVIYSDGGARPDNPGPAGWGFHGYTYNAVKPKKGSGLPDYWLTNQGYVHRSESPNGVLEATQEHWEKFKLAEDEETPSFEVTPVSYVDGYGSFAQAQSNNFAELTASIEALRYANEHQIEIVVVYTDSKYVCEGFSKWMAGWKRNNWVKRDGMPVANSQSWIELEGVVDQMKARGVVVSINWVKGHSDHAGNDAADHLATAGTARSYEAVFGKNPGSVHDVSTTPAEGYWKYDAERHPFVSKRAIYYNTDPEYVKPGMYVMGDRVKDVELLGGRNRTDSYAVVLMKNHDPAIEMMRNHQIELCDGANTICLTRLEELFNPLTHRHVTKFGRYSFSRKSRWSLDTRTLADRPLTEELNPARLATRVADAAGDLTEKLKLFLENAKEVCVTDLTPILYESTEKPQKKAKSPEGTSETVMTLKSEYKVGFASLKVDANYRDAEDVKAAPLILILGQDLLDRNALKRLESFQPKVSLITWNEAENVFRYATVVQAGEDVGIWCGYYSNLRILAK